MMARYIAFLRAINVGGHTVRMGDLRQIFEDLGFTGVRTFLASGNVAFESSTQNLKMVEKAIEAGLLQALGYEVVVFLRTLDSLPQSRLTSPSRQSRSSKLLP